VNFGLIIIKHAAPLKQLSLAKQQMPQLAPAGATGVIASQSLTRLKILEPTHPKLLPHRSPFIMWVFKKGKTDAWRRELDRDLCFGSGSCGLWATRAFGRKVE
jgi:hypothetical protein